MPRRFTNFLILYKSSSEKAGQLSSVVASWLREQGFHSHICEADAISVQDAKDTDCAIVLGGDGTILGLARRLAGKNIPIFGINFGRVGFLAASDPQNWRERLNGSISGRIPARHCLVLKWRLQRNGVFIDSGVAVNDLVVSCGSLARIVSLDITICDMPMGLLRSDGLIVCTPLGSTGYNISAGGPVLAPDMNAICLSPVCPFITNISPLVFPAEAFFQLRVASSVDSYLTIDGQEGQKLELNDLIHIDGWPSAIEFLAGRQQFFEKLQSRGFNLEKQET